MVIWKLAATVANAEETPVYSIKSQNPAGVLGLDGNKMMLVDTSAVDYATNTELTGEIQAIVGSATATAAFTISITDGAGIYIPDAKFKAVLVKNTALNTDGDQEISVAEAQAYAGAIDEGRQGITDAIGIEYFTNITSLNLAFNALTALNVSNNTVLNELVLSDNQLTTLDVSKNTVLDRLALAGNQLTTLDISNNTTLTNLDLSVNQLTAIDVSKNTALIDLFLGNNQLTTLDVSKFTALESLILEINQLTILDVSQNTALIQLVLANNALTKVNLANGNNNAILDLNLLENPDLTCVQVDDPSSFKIKWEGKYDKDKVTFQTTECSN